MRIGPHTFVRRGNPYHAQRISRPSSCLIFAYTSVMCLDRLSHLRFDAQHRIQCHHGILKDHGDPASAHLLNVCRRKLGQVASLKQDFTTNNAAGRIDQTQNGKSSNRFPRPGLPDKSNNFTSSNLKAYAVYSLENSTFGEEMGL